MPSTILTEGRVCSGKYGCGELRWIEEFRQPHSTYCRDCEREFDRFRKGWSSAFDPFEIPVEPTRLRHLLDAQAAPTEDPFEILADRPYAEIYDRLTRLPIPVRWKVSHLVARALLRNHPELSDSAGIALP